MSAWLALKYVSEALEDKMLMQGRLDTILLEAARQAQVGVSDYYMKRGQRGGTTMTMLALRGDCYAFANVGDSPAFVWNAEDQRLIELSCRHNLYWNKVREGIPPKLEDQSKLMNYIGKIELDPNQMRFFGADIHELIHITEGKLEGFGGFLLCSDGVTNALDPDTLMEHLRSGATAEELVCLSANYPQADNCTAVCLSFEENE
jgi:serine/threonine protein phosphatase PrpC